MQAFFGQAFGALIAAVAVCAASPVSAESLESELAQLLASHPELASAEKSVDAAREGIREARSGYLPTVVLSGDGGHEYVDSPGRRLSPGSALNKGRNRVELSVTENLFAGFRDQSRLEVANLSVDVAEKRRQALVQRMMYDGARAYIDVIRTSQLAELARADEDIIRRQLSLEDERVRRGSGIGVDVLLAKARLQVAKERRVAFEGQLRQAHDRYNRLFGRMAEPAKLTEPTPPLDLIPQKIEDAIAAAREANPNLAVSGLTVSVNDRERDVAAAEYYPRLDLVARGTREDNVDGAEGLRRDWSVLLEARWELYSGARTQARVSRAGLKHSASKDDHAAADRQTEEETRLAWDTLATARERVELLMNAVTIAAEVFDARDKLRRAGKESAVNVLNAEEELYTARIGLTDARHQAMAATYRLLAALGHLTPENLKLKPAASQ